MVVKVSGFPGSDVKSSQTESQNKAEIENAGFKTLKTKVLKH